MAVTDNAIEYIRKRIRVDEKTKCKFCGKWHDVVKINSPRGQMKVSTCPEAGSVGGLVQMNTLGNVPTHVSSQEIRDSLIYGVKHDADAYAMHVKLHAELAADVERERMRRDPDYRPIRYGVGRREPARLTKLCACGQTGKHAFENRPNAWRCDACELAHVRELHMQKRQHVIDLCHAILPADQIELRCFDEVVTDAIAKVKLMRKECEEPRPDPIWGQGIAEQLSGINSVVRGESPSGKALQVHQEYMRDIYQRTLDSMAKSYLRTAAKVMESGPGLAARYPDATKAAKPEQEIITCDLGADYE